MRRAFLLVAISLGTILPGLSNAASGTHHPIVIVHRSPDGAAARSGTLTFLDHETFEVVGTATVPAQPRPMEFDATGSTLIVLGESASRGATGASTRPWRLFLVDVRSGKVRDLGDVGLPPIGFAFSPEKNRAYLFGAVRKKPEGTLSVVDLATGSVVRRLSTPPGRPTAILGPGSRLLFAMFGFGETTVNDPEPRMVVYDSSTLERVAEQALDPSPRRPVLGADGEFVYVASAGRTDADRPVGGGVFVFDAASGRLAAKIPTGPGTRPIAQDPESSVVWAVAAGSGATGGSVTAIRGAQVVGRVELPIGYGHVYPVPGGGVALVMGRNSVHAVKVSPFQNVASWFLDFEPAYAAYDVPRRRAWIAAGYGSDFAAIDLETGKVLTQGLAGREGVEGAYPAEPGSLVMALSPDGRHVYLANTRSDDVTIVDAETLAIEEIVATGGRTDSVLLAPSGSCVYVVAGESIVRIDADTLQEVRQCAIASRSGIAGVVNVHDGVALVPQESAVEFVSMEDGRSVRRQEFERPVDYVFVASPEH